MKAAVYEGPNNIRLAEWPDPRIEGDDEVVVRVSTCLVCATDVKAYQGMSRHFRPGAVLGHELAGTVVAVGSAVRDLPVGTRVVVAPYVEDGQCDQCRRGRPLLCRERRGLSNGGFAEFVKLDGALARKGLVHVPEGVPMEVAAFTEPLACVLHGIEDAAIRPGDVTLILGAGPMGLLHVAAARLRGAARVIVSEPHPARRELAAEFGALAVAPDEVSSTVHRVTRGRGADQVVLAVGVPELVEQALQWAAPGGTVVLFAGFSPGARAAVDVNRVHYDGVRLVGESGFTSDAFHRAAELLFHGTFPVSRLVTHRFALEDIARAFAAAASGEAVKVAVTLEDGRRYDRSGTEPEPGAGGG